MEAKCRQPVSQMECTSKSIHILLCWIKLTSTKKSSTRKSSAILKCLLSVVNYQINRCIKIIMNTERVNFISNRPPPTTLFTPDPYNHCLVIIPCTILNRITKSSKLDSTCCKHSNLSSFVQILSC